MKNLTIREFFEKITPLISDKNTTGSSEIEYGSIKLNPYDSFTIDTTNVYYVFYKYKNEPTVYFVELDSSKTSENSLLYKEYIEEKNSISDEFGNVYFVILDEKSTIKALLLRKI